MANKYQKLVLVSKKGAIMRREAHRFAGVGSVGSKEVLNEFFEIYDRGSATPKVVRLGVLTLGEAEQIANDYLKYNQGPVVILRVAKTIEVCRTLR